jgi:hypothetical protein
MGMISGKPDYRLWLRRVLGWDGLLPLINASVPVVVKLLMPKQQELFSFIVFGLPFLSLIIRAQMGDRQIKSNNCGPGLRLLQMCSFGFGVFLLAFLDMYLMAFIMLPQAFPGIGLADILIAACSFFVYLMLMAFAMYPGCPIG